MTRDDNDRTWVCSDPVALGHYPNYPSPQFGQLVHFLSDIEIQELKDSLGLKMLDMLNSILYDSIATVGESRVWWRADFQSGSRVLKKMF